jgi:hypothetical protein
VLQWIPGIDGGYEHLRANAIEDEVPGVGDVAGRPQDEADLYELEQVRRDSR